jgi:hypothetical protein
LAISAVFSAISLLVDKPVDNRPQLVLHQRENVIGLIIGKMIELSALKIAGGEPLGVYTSYAIGATEVTPK